MTESDGKSYSTSLPELALHLAASMRINATGGVPCEPGLVFFQCQNHPFCAFTLLEGLGHFPRGFFDEEKVRTSRHSETNIEASNTPHFLRTNSNDVTSLLASPRSSDSTAFKTSQ